MEASEGVGAIAEVQPFLFVDHTRLLQTSLSKYFNKPLFSDITVIGPDGRKLLCHQVVLSAGSKRFANMLEQGNLANEELPVWGVDSDALQSIIEFFYSGQCELTFPAAVAVMDAANRLDVPSLTSAAHTYVREALSAATATTTLAHALQYKLGDLVSSCLDLIADNFDAVAASKDFGACSFDTLKRILTHMESCGGVSDETIFRAAWKWTVLDPSRSKEFSQVLQVVRVPPTISLKELLDAGTEGGSIAAMAMAAMAGGQQQQQQGSQGNAAGASAGGAAGGADDSKAAAAASSGRPVSAQPRPASSAGTGAGEDTAAAGDAAAAAVPLTVVVKPEKGAPTSSSGPNTSAAAPQGTLSSFEPLSGGPQPTPTSKAPLPGDASAMFGPAAAAAAAAAGLGGLQGVPQAGAMDPQQLAAMYAGYYPMGAAAAKAGDGSNAAAAAAGADGNAVSGTEGAQQQQQQLSPDKMAAWGGMGMMAGGMQMGGMMAGYMPGFMPGMMSPGFMPAMGQVMPSGAYGGSSASRNTAKGVCQVENCNADLRGLKDYHLRYKICEYHLKVGSIMRDGVQQRFCQQCGRFHPLQDFDGTKRSCRARLLRHNARRRKRGEEEMAGMGYGSSSSGLKRGRGSSSQMQDMEVDGGGSAAAAAAAAGGYWMGGNMDPYMAMAAMGGMGGFSPDGSFNPQAMMQYGQFGMVSPTGSMLPGVGGDMGGQAGGQQAGAGSGGTEGEEDDQNEGGAAAAGGSGTGTKRGGRGRGRGGASKAQGSGDWAGEEGEDAGGRDEEGGHDEMAWAAAGLEMLADVAQARTSAAGDRSRAGSDAGSRPAEGADGAAAAAAEGAAAGTGGQQADEAAKQQPPSEQQQQPQTDLAAQQQEQQQEQPQGACGVAPLQLADSPSPHAAAAGGGGSGGLFAGRVSSPGHDAPPTEPGADDSAAAPAAGAVTGGGSGAGSGAGKSIVDASGMPGGAGSGAAAASSGGGAAANGADGRLRLPSGAGASSSPSNDLAFRADKPGAPAGTVRG